jgi:hypothetical protein
LLFATTVGTALLAIWCYLRWPGAAPKTLRASVAYVIAGFLALHLSTVILGWSVGISVGAMVVSFVGVIVPVLTFAFLAALWIMRLFADTIRGYI